jgi:putative hydrolase of the HAD superfamily
MSEIKNILWDVGGVLLTNGWDHKERTAVLEQFGVEREPFEARHTAANDAWESGRLSAADYLAQTIFYKPRKFSPEDFLEAMKKQSQWLPGGAIRILQSLAASEKWKIATVNNEGREVNDYRVACFGLNRYFSCFFSSCYVGLRKPDPAIHRLALDVLQIRAEETVFIDDRLENVQGAASLGIHGIRYTGEESLRTELKELGVVVK